MTIYAIAIPIALVAPLAACALYIIVAVLWLIPDRRIETTLRRTRMESANNRCGRSAAPIV